ncbi:MAG: putative Isochorismatase hydrolase [Acidimicrobiia bacterium]|nr:putative Isochorismatase hydrolase [Acidimicrobiia bacterium]
MRGLDDLAAVALLTIECQNGATNPDYSSLDGLPGQCAERGIMERIAVLSAVCRSLDIPVFHSKLVHRDDWRGSNLNSPLLGSNRKRRKMIAGNPDSDLHPALDAQPQDFVLERTHGVTPFYGSALDQLLRNCGVSTLIVTGVSTNLGVLGGVIEAVNRGYSVIVAEDCTAGVWPEAHSFVIEQLLPPLAVIASSEEVAGALRRP